MIYKKNLIKTIQAAFSISRSRPSSSAGSSLPAADTLLEDTGAESAGLARDCVLGAAAGLGLSAAIVGRLG